MLSFVGHLLKFIKHAFIIKLTKIEKRAYITHLFGQSFKMFKLIFIDYFSLRTLLLFFIYNVYLIGYLLIVQIIFTKYSLLLISYFTMWTFCTSPNQLSIYS